MIKGTTNSASWTAFVLLALGCGGRAESQASVGVGGGEAAGGSPSIAVAGSSAGGSTPIGTDDAGATGGSAGAAGSGCAQIACPGETGDCIGGYQWGTPPGACCPRCTPESTSDCAQGLSNYGEFFQSQLESNNSCNTDTDCAIGYEGNACILGCGFPISAASAATVVSALKEYASNNCSTCPPQIPPSCPAQRVACVNGLCALTP